MSPTFRLGLACVLTLPLAGCGVSSGRTGTSTIVPTASYRISGSLHGGQQPIAGASLALYAAGKTGPASGARSMLNSPVSTQPDGSFDITGDYSCQPSDQVYLVGTGGNAGGGANPAIALMTALGPCNALAANSYISVNEVTTAASIQVLSPFMTGMANVGADASHANDLAAAFATTQTLVNTTSGAAPQTSTGNGQVPQTTINSLANSIAACINSTPSDGSCASLFSAAGGSASDTLQATLNILKNPTAMTSTIFGLASATPPFQPTLTAAPASYALLVAHPSDVLMYHNNAARTGVQSFETTLTPANVKIASFGKKFTFPVDSYQFAQPLYVGGVGMPDGTVHNIVVASTTHATVYAFDADGNNPGSGSLWSVSLLPTGERYAQASDYGGCTNPPEAGIVGTPVIDRASMTIYLVTKTITTTGGVFYHRIHALSLIDGSERPNSPQIIAPAFQGNGEGSVNNMVPFDGQHESQRPALLLTADASGSKTVWIGYASQCDIGPYHGLVLGYNAANVSQATATFNATPNGSEGGIWMGAGGLNADANGFIYGWSGNGTFDAYLGGGGVDYGESAIKLSPPAAGANSTLMSVNYYFTPSNQTNLSNRDLDTGGTEGILFTDSGSGKQMLIGSDKNGYIYLLDTANMGTYDSGTHGPDGKNGDVQDFQPLGRAYIYNFAFHNNVLYTSNPPSSFAYNPGSGSTPGTFTTTPIVTTQLSASAPVISANGLANPVVWTQDSSGTLHAYTEKLATEIYNTTQAPNGRDTAAAFVKFTSPVIANGNVYLSGQGAVVVYGLLQ